MGLDVNNIAPPGGDYWQPSEGDRVSGLITYMDTYQRTNNWSKVEENLRIDLEQADGSAIIVTVVTNADCEGEGYAKRDAKAVAAAVRAAGATQLEVGGRLGMVRLGDVQTKMGLGRDYAAEYLPPTVGVPATGIAAAQAPTAAPAAASAAQPAPAPAAAAPQPAPAPAPVPAEEAPAAPPSITGLV